MFPPTQIMRPLVTQENVCLPLASMHFFLLAESNLTLEQEEEEAEDEEDAKRIEDELPISENGEKEAASETAPLARRASLLNRKQKK